MKQRHKINTMLRGLLLPVGAVIVLVFFASAINNMDKGREMQNTAQLENALRRGCAACYAAEGVYPRDLEYLSERYGVQIDDERYRVYYTVIAQNLMPDITVLEK